MISITKSNKNILVSVNVVELEEYFSVIVSNHIQDVHIPAGLHSSEGMSTSQMVNGKNIVKKLPVGQS